MKTTSKIVFIFLAVFCAIMGLRSDPISVPPGVNNFNGSSTNQTLFTPIVIGGTISGVVFSGAATNNTLLGSPTSALVGNSLGWGWTNTASSSRQFVIINFDLTPAAAAQACVDVFWTNSAGVVSNRFATGIGIVAQSITCTGILESNGVVQVRTNRLNGATTVQNLINSTATPLP